MSNKVLIQNITTLTTGRKYKERGYPLIVANKLYEREGYQVIEVTNSDIGYLVLFNQLQTEALTDKAVVLNFLNELASKRLKNRKKTTIAFVLYNKDRKTNYNPYYFYKVIDGYIQTETTLVDWFKHCTVLANIANNYWKEPIVENPKTGFSIADMLEARIKKLNELNK